MSSNKGTTITSDFIDVSSKEFSIYTAQNRAIPHLADGLKDGQRKAIWLMRHKQSPIKTISLAGEMLSSGLYLHGDGPAANSISSLAAPFLNNIPLLDGIGAFGTRSSPLDGIASPRYTSIRRYKPTDLLVYQDLDIVPMQENYDGSALEPKHFLPLVPLVLLNGNKGIAVGWSTAILPHALVDLVDQTINALTNKKVKEILPDYAFMQHKNVVETEPSKYEFTGHLSIVNTTTVKIDELPPAITLEAYRTRLNKLEEDGVIAGYTDRSTKTVDITVKMKRGSFKDEADLIDKLKLVDRATERLVVLNYNGKSIMQYETKAQLIKDFVKWRLGWYVTRYERLLADNTTRHNYLLGIKACFKAKLPAKLQSMKSKSDLIAEIKKITSKIELTDTQVDNISGFASYRWAKDYEAQIDENIKECETLNAEYNDILNDEKKRKDIYVKELKEIRKELC